MGRAAHQANLRWITFIAIHLFEAAIACPCGAAMAQVPTGSIKGSAFIVDRGGSRSYIPGARIRLVSEGGIIVRETASNDIGRFSLELLAAGRYSVTAEHSGMKPSEQWVTVNPGALVEIELEMRLVEVKEVVAVSASIPETIQPSETSSGSRRQKSTLANAPNLNERLLPS